MVFSNLDAIRRYREELLTIRVAGVDGTFKTVPHPFRSGGCLPTFQVVFNNVVRILV